MWISVADAYVLSGTVINNSGKTGRTYLSVNDSRGYGTSINSSGAFSISGVPSGTYTITAVMDTRGDGKLFVSDPTGVSASFNVASADKNGIAITLTNPSSPPPPTPSWLKVYPGDGLEVLMWDIKANYDPYTPIADHYNLYWSTSPTVAPGNTTGGGSKLGIPHPGYGPFYLTGLPNGSTLYFVITATVKGIEGSPSPVYGPVTIGSSSGTGGVTVEGTINILGITPTGPLFIGLWDGAKIGAEQYIASPTTTQGFKIDNVQDGYKGFLIVLDNNNNGVEDAGDLSTDFAGGPVPPILVQGAPISGLSLNMPTGNGKAGVCVEYVYPNSYSLFFMAKYHLKLITNMTVLSGPNLAQPIDVPWDDGWFDTWSFDLPGHPNIGDTYGLSIRYADGTIEAPDVAITAVPDGFATPISPSGITSGTTPVLTWTLSPAPSEMPFSYTVNVYTASGSRVWQIQVANNRTSVTYNEDGTAEALVSGDQYYWRVQFKDQHGNRSVGPIVYFTPTDPTLNVTINGPGAGDVNSSPAGINCGVSCSTQFPLNRVVRLSATPSTGGSIFSEWSGDPDCADGIVTLGADKSCVATFDLCNAISIAMTGSSGPFDSIDAAYKGAFSTDIIKIIASNQQEGDLVFYGKNLTLQGGYDCFFFEPPTSMTIITGSLTISGGSVTMSGIRIQ